MKTVSISKYAIKKEWRLIDAKDVVLGRLASVAASLLRGKHKPTYTPHMDDGDHVVIINAKNVALTGRKTEQKVYYHHTGYVGHLRTTTFATMLAKHPERIIAAAIKGMLPKNKLGRAQYRHLYIYPDATHKHDAQNPRPYKIT